jgi:predicted Zn-dependent protease
MLSIFSRLKNFSLLALIVINLLTACATNIAGRNQVMLVSESQAIESSKLAYAEMLDPLEKEGKIDSDPATVKRINHITDRLVEQAMIKRPDSADWEWSVKVIDDPETVNAWCMAGGKMAIYTGLIQKLDATDDEIAQVMGHEISHALANHSAERMSMAIASGLAVTAISVATDSSPTTTALTAMAAQVALTLPNSRTSEAEADVLGIEIAAKAGYDPNAAVTLWQKMEKVSGSGGLEFLSTHPAPENRQKKLQQLIPKMMPYYLAAKQ